MRARTLWWILFALMIAPVGGCLEGVDPVTGKPTVGLDPNSAIVRTGEAGAEAVGLIAPLLGQTGVLIGGLVLGALGLWRKVKPTLTTARTQAEQYHAATAATVTALEEYKKASPESWATLGKIISDQLEKQGIDPKTVENVIRAIRGLPPKA